MDKNSGRREFVGSLAGMAAAAYGLSACTPGREEAEAESVPVAIPMLKYLEVEFGGLCMLVRNNAKAAERNGLFALMPKADWPDMVHCPMVFAPSEHIGGVQDKVAPLKDFVDLRFLNSKDPSSLPDKILEISTYANKRVDKRWIDATAPADCLAGRIRLPLAVSKITYGKTGKLKVPNAPNGKDFVGRVTLTFRVDAGHISSLAIGPFNLIPNAQGIINVKFLNVRLSDLQRVGNVKAKEDAPVTHVKAYYWLLDGNCPNHQPDPNIPDPGIKVGENVSGDDGIYLDNKCYTKIEPVNVRTRGRFAANWIDPIQCTVGNGCGPDEDAC